MDALENVTFDRLRVLFSPGTFGGSGSDYLDNSFAYRAHGDVHTGDGKVFRKNSRSRMTQILEAPPTATNQSSCYKQYTISGLSLEAVSLGTCAQVSEVEVNGIKFTGTAMPSYQMDGSKIEQNVVQVSATSSIVETVAQTPASSSQCPISHCHSKVD